ncbi:hypothetical protein BH20ACT12_BH20ACT12_01400 [soil metagenome]
MIPKRVNANGTTEPAIAHGPPSYKWIPASAGMTCERASHAFPPASRTHSVRMDSVWLAEMLIN